MALALPEPTPGRWAGTWQADPFGIAAVVLLGGLYGWGVLRARRRGHRWPAVRTGAFAVLGLGTIAVATMSSLAVYGRVLFWPAAVQNILLDLVAPLGLALGDPLALARLALPERAADRLGRVLRGRVLRVLTFPVISTVLVLASELSVYFTPYFGTALRDGAVHSLLYLQLLLTGCLFVLPMLSREDLLPAWCTHPLRALFVFVDGLVDAIPGILVMTSGTRIAAGWYAAQQPGWGPGPDRDQVLGGGLMLGIAELVGLPFLIAVFVEWVRADRVRTAELDRRLDAEAATTADAAEPGQVPVPEATRPWWETDPGIVGERFRQGR